jgi:predicted membrane protein
VNRDTVMPSKILAGPLVAVAAAMTAVLTEYKIGQARRTLWLPLWGAMVGAVAGMAIGALLGLALAVLLAVILMLVGHSAGPAMGVLVEGAALTGVASLLVGFALGLTPAPIERRRAASRSQRHP